MESSKPNRRWFQFSLRALFVLMLLASGYFAGWASALRQVRQAELKAKEAAEMAHIAAAEALRQAEQARMLAEKQRLQLEVENASTSGSDSATGRENSDR